MSARTKGSDTDNTQVTVGVGKPKRFSVPKKKAKSLVVLLSDYEIEDDDDQTVPAEEVFKDLYQKYGKSGTTLRGARGINNMTQVQLAKKLGIPQTDVSQMENGKRPIGKKMAKRLAKVFKTDYRVFL